jgi:hypothetical protein
MCEHRIIFHLLWSVNNGYKGKWIWCSHVTLSLGKMQVSLRYCTRCFYAKWNSIWKSQKKIAWSYSSPQRHYSEVNEMWNGMLMDMEPKCEHHVSADEKLKLRCISKSRIKRDCENCHEVTGATASQNIAVHSLKSCHPAVSYVVHNGKFHPKLTCFHTRIGWMDMRTHKTW